VVLSSNGRIVIYLKNGLFIILKVRLAQTSAAAAATQEKRLKAFSIYRWVGF